MRILEVCPECGSDIVALEVCTDPPIPVRECTKCGWRWEGEREETLRIPFNPDGYENIVVRKGNYVLKVPMVAKIEIHDK